MPEQSDQGYSEDSLIEQPAIELFGSLGYKNRELLLRVRRGATLGRATTAEVVLVPKLRAALKKLNGNIPALEL